MNRNTINVLFLAQLDPNKLGTMEEFCLCLSKSLSNKGYGAFFGFASAPADFLKKEFDANNANVCIIKFADQSFFSKIKMAIQLNTLIRKNNISIVHINFFGLTIAPMLGVYASRAKIVFSDHSSGQASERKGFRRLLAMVLHRFIGLKVSKYIAVSQFVENRLKITHYVSAKKRLTIYNGINFSRFCREPQNKARLKLGIDLNAKIIVAVASQIPEKGLHVLIRAIAILEGEYKDSNIHALLIGDGWYTSELKSLAVKLGVQNQVHFLGRKSNVHTFISAADIVVVPSLWEEAFGLIVAEAMASKVPVIASKIGGIPELIEPNVTGLLIEPGNAKGLAKAIVQLMQDEKLKKLLSEQAYLKAREMFDLDDQISSTIKIYESI